MYGVEKLLYIVAAIVMLLMVVLMLFVETPTKEAQPLFGQLRVKTTEKNDQAPLTRYQKHKSKSIQSAEKLRYKERIKKDNPIFSFYRAIEKKEEKSAKKEPVKKAPEPKKREPKKEE